MAGARVTVPLLVLVAIGLVPGSNSASAAQWTVGIYMCADNGMNDVADADLAEMEQVGSSAEVNVVVQVDRAARDPRPGCHRYLIRNGGVDTLADIGEVDMADSATLAGFAGFLRSRYPATNYALVLWDHGNGWYPGYGPRASAIFIDDSHGHEMGVAGGEFARAMTGVKHALGKRVRILVFDACLMGMIEVADEVRDDCDYMVASEALVPNDGLPYEKFLDRLTGRPTGAPAELLPDICADYVDAYPGQQVALSALEMAKLAPALDRMAATLSGIDAAGAKTHAARATAQTMPGNSTHVDLLDFLEIVADGASDSLRASLRSAVVANERSPGLERVLGLAVWFPDDYLALKASLAPYLTLGFGRESGWPQFLNRYFGSDDLKPDQPAISQVWQGNRGDAGFWWNSCFDLAPVRYSVYEVTGLEEILTDYGDDFSNWINRGWTTSTQQIHSGQSSFFSDTTSNLENSIASARPLSLAGGGLLSFYAWWSTQEDWDSTAGLTRDICYVERSSDRQTWHSIDSLYGDFRFWQERRYLLPPAGETYLRFRYASGPTVNGQGVYIDDIKVYSFDTIRVVAAGTRDTTARVFNVPRDTAGYRYCVTAVDSFGNVSMVSQLHRIDVTTWAEPYTRPAPFSGQCQLVLDFPAGETPDVLVYALSGALVRRFVYVDERVVEWDGNNEAGKPLADGLYLVVVRSPRFRKIGKIAKVARRSG